VANFTIVRTPYAFFGGSVALMMPLQLTSNSIKYIIAFKDKSLLGHTPAVRVSRVVIFVQNLKKRLAGVAQ
jgi:hypothetical protein